MLASLRDTSHAITRLERVVAGDVGVDSAERLATEINQVPSGIEKVSYGNYLTIDYYIIMLRHRVIL